MHLHYKKSGSGPPFLILHGLYGSSDNWVTVAKELSEVYTVYIPDLRNHGRSPHEKTHNYEVLQQDVYDFIEEHQLGQCTILGHSMGGKTAMLFALKNPQLVGKLIIVDIAPKEYKSLDSLHPHVIEHLNIINALTSIDIKSVQSRAEIDMQLEFYIKDIRLRQFLLKNITRNADNSFKWMLNLDVIAQSLPTVLSGIDYQKYQSEASIRNFPTLFIKGEKSTYIDDNDVYPIKQMFPKAEIVTIFDAGHWVNTDQPEAFIKALKYFLAE